MGIPRAADGEMRRCVSTQRNSHQVFMCPEFRVQKEQLRLREMDLEHMGGGNKHSPNFGGSLLHLQR